MPCIFHLTQFSMRGPKHIEVNCHFIREKIASGCMATSFVNSNDQLEDIFIKSLKDPRIKYLCDKFGVFYLYAPTRGGVLRISFLIHLRIFSFSL